MPQANRNISLRALRAFSAAAERESFRAAAEHLFLTSSAVSHQIKQLETELGKSLFIRTARSLKLSQSGRELYDELVPVLASLDAIVARHKSDSTRESLRVSVQPFFASEMFVPCLPNFVEQNPDIDLNIDTSDQSAEKHPENADVSIRIFRSPPGNLSYDCLFPLSLMPVASPEFYDSVKVVSNRVTSEMPLVVHSARPNAWKQWEKSSRIRLPKTNNVMQLDSMIAVARAAERGLGAALVPRQLSQSWLQSSALVPLFDDELLTRDAYYLVCRPDDETRRGVSVFRRWALQNFGDSR